MSQSRPACQIQAEAARKRLPKLHSQNLHTHLPGTGRAWGAEDQQGALQLLKKLGITSFQHSFQEAWKALAAFPNRAHLFQALMPAFDELHMTLASSKITIIQEYLGIPSWEGVLGIRSTHLHCILQCCHQERMCQEFGYISRNLFL